MMPVETTYSETLATFVSTLAAGGIPDRVMARARLHVLDTLGVGLTGSRAIGASNLAHTCARTHGGGGEGARVWGVDGRMAPPALAALVNGAAIHAEDYDDTHTTAIVHGSSCVVPAAWAYAEQSGLSGEAVLVAVVAGWEVAARVGLAAVGAFHEQGLHTTSVAGVFGAAAAVGSLMGFNANQLAHALGIAGSLASGINAYLADGTRVKTLHPGMAAQGGLTAASMAAAGMTGPRAVFEGTHGLFEVFAGGRHVELKALNHALGHDWEMARVSIKPYPACHCAHGSIDCALELRVQGVTPDDIADVECFVPPLAADLICEPWENKLEPQNPYIAKFSLPYLVAAAFVEGRVNRGSFTSDAIRHSEVTKLMERVRWSTWLDSDFPDVFPGRVIVTLHDGRRVEAVVPINRGHPDNPLEDDEVTAKFLDNAEGIVGARRAADLVRRVGALESEHDLSGLSECLTSHGKDA